MGIRPTYSPSALQKQLKQKMERSRRAMINTLCYVGEQCVNRQRQQRSPDPTSFGKTIPPHQPNYIDWTANLRSSIGYVVVADGEVVKMSSFEPVKGGDEGAQRGRQFAREIAARYNNGIALILVAGMKYAAYVSSKSYDVLNTCVTEAEDLIPRLMRQLNDVIDESNT